MGWFTADVHTMDDLFLHSLQDIYYAEKQIEKSLPDMVAKASDGELKKGFQMHLKQTRGQIKRLDQAFKKLKQDPRARNARRSTASSMRRTTSPATSTTRWCSTPR